MSEYNQSKERRKSLGAYTTNTNELERLVHVDELLTRVRICRDHSGLQMKILTDLTAVDYPERSQRFEIIYNRLSLRYGIRLILKVRLNEIQSVPTRTGRYRSANWIERERWDMFGVSIEGHPDLRRILTDYGFEGHPLRKDFPLTGFTEVRYDEHLKRVVSEPLELSQEFRSFEYGNPWR
jgi:NADH dehydrogenase (ubiquinone) Fe-S protein 3